MKQLLLVDVDEHLTVEECFTVEECAKATPNQDWVDWTNRHYEEDFIIIYTARRDRLTEVTKDWLHKNKVKYHCYNNTKIPGRICDAGAINKTGDK